MDRINAIRKQITSVDISKMKRAQERLDALTKPPGSLGKLEEIARLIVGITGKENPVLEKKIIFTFAADHGVVIEGVSAFPQAVTGQMVYNFLSGGAGINVLARHAGARVVVADLGVASDLKPDRRLIIRKINYGTKNMAEGPAMTRDEALRSIEAGIEIFEEEFKQGVDIVGIGEMGIGNTTAASAITATFTNMPPAQLTGRGTGLNDQALENKIRVIEKALGVNKPNVKDPIDVLAKVGGFEIGGLTGVILAASARRVPVVIDGFISGAAALIAYCLEPKTKEYMIASHASVERGHICALNYIGLKPVFDLELRLGEGTGAALAMGIIDASLKIMTEMATFKGAQVSEAQ
ncbi:MAG: nicotinate-nucleotide--dimethylbenzimidazole phosphoribosyltransferase [Candidatus Omnitrophica bacterium]|nr:nicotinate-nucleotide--dimethylbenzimidazole phosphoribosyltransferase [Candidatus Omnitrophota bacterium]MBU4468811.1 nicotinate-nucleotide--dimethylbenzimidazole phosphoribosyltransferase [Candidatus Omnitrophota bacterium]MCG2708138.1 nicotinate-nucleotide--dimethylbenzimidazole phosphoribosyltransferase [Candidatus Omnitrophota bacterium]